jgi:hypothetical protein
VQGWYLRSLYNVHAVGCFAEKIAVTKNVEPSLIYWRCKLCTSLQDHITCYCTECILLSFQVFQLLYVNLLGISYNLNWKQHCLFSYCWNIIVTAVVPFLYFLTLIEIIQKTLLRRVVLCPGGREGGHLSERTTTYWCLASLIDWPYRVVLPQPNRAQHILQMLDFNVAVDKVW